MGFVFIGLIIFWLSMVPLAAYGWWMCIMGKTSGFAVIIIACGIFFGFIYNSHAFFQEFMPHALEHDADYCIKQPKAAERAGVVCPTISIR